MKRKMRNFLQKLNDPKLSENLPKGGFDQWGDKIYFPYKNYKIKWFGGGII